MAENAIAGTSARAHRFGVGVSVTHHVLGEVHWVLPTSRRFRSGGNPSSTTKNAHAARTSSVHSDLSLAPTQRHDGRENDNGDAVATPLHRFGPVERRRLRTASMVRDSRRSRCRDGGPTRRRAGCAELESATLCDAVSFVVRSELRAQNVRGTRSRGSRRSCRARAPIT